MPVKSAYVPLKKLLAAAAPLALPENTTYRSPAVPPRSVANVEPSMLNVWLPATAASKLAWVMPRSCTTDWLVLGFQTARNTSDGPLLGLLICASAAEPKVTAAAAKHSRLRFNMGKSLHLRG